MSIHLEWTTYGTIISCTVAHESSTKCILWILLCSSVPSPTLDTWIRNMKWISDVWRAHSKYERWTHKTEHKIRKLSEISASEAENYLGYQTVGTGWLHYTLYHTDSNAWFILFFVIYSSHARNSYSLEIILYIKTIIPSSTPSPPLPFPLLLPSPPYFPSTQIKSIQLHCTLMNVLGKTSITYQLSQSSWQIVDTSLFVLCCWTSNRRYGKNVSVQYKYIYIYIWAVSIVVIKTEQSFAISSEMCT